MSRSRLGRGLSALIPEDILDNQARPDGGALQQIRIDQIRPNPEQPRLRFAASALDELAESIKTHGVLTPILVRRVSAHEYILIAGERRLRASGLAGMETIPAWIRDDVSSQAQLELALIENIQREDLDPIETAMAYQRMIAEFQLTQAEVARRVGKDRATVANAVRILRLPTFVLEELRGGRITAGHAKALLPISEPTVLRKALREVINRDLSVRATERMVSTIIKPSRKSSKATAPAYKAATEQLAKSLNTRVRIEPRARGKRGKIVIDYFSPEELNRLVEQLRGTDGSQ
jgi:ParB family chromosome partitioning protein